MPTSATLLGACLTVIGLIRLLEVSRTIATLIDNILAIDSLLFLAAAVLSYLSMRRSRDRRGLERKADLVVMAGLFVIAATCVMLAWEIGFS